MDLICSLRSCLAGIQVPFLHVNDAEHKGEQHAESAHCDVAHRQEIVLASEGIGRADYEALLALEGSNFVIVHDLKIVFASRQSRVDSAPQLPEVWQTCRSHPDDKMFCKRLEDLM